MISFTVPSMSCGHCVGVITRALKTVEPQAQVEIDLAAKRVQVQGSADRQRLAQALAEAGYPPVAAAEPLATARGGCGCGCR